MSDDASPSWNIVNPKRLGFQQAIDLFGQRCVISLAGAGWVAGPERDGYLPMLFRLRDGRLFYGRSDWSYKRRGFVPFRSHPGAVFLQMTIEGAEIQCQKEQIPFPPEWKKLVPIPDPPCDPTSPPATDSPLPPEPGVHQPPDEFIDYVTLDQAAAAAHKSKRTLERRKTEGKLPPPSVEGGGGEPDLWDWSVMRVWLQEEFRVMLPARFPARRL
jgi:hypothetical protein